MTHSSHADESISSSNTTLSCRNSNFHLRLRRSPPARLRVFQSPAMEYQCDRRQTGLTKAGLTTVREKRRCMRDSFPETRGERKTLQDSSRRRLKTRRCSRPILCPASERGSIFVDRPSLSSMELFTLNPANCRLSPGKTRATGTAARTCDTDRSSTPGRCERPRRCARCAARYARRDSYAALR